MKTAESVKARLKSYAQKNHYNVQDIFIMYVLERLLYRISISSYKEFFILKGGILLYGLMSERFKRMTTDIDLLGENVSNDIENMRSIFSEILAIECDDAIRFDIDKLDVRKITEFKEYHGVNVSVLSRMDHTRIPVNIDIGFHDVLTPSRIEMVYPSVLKDESPVLYAYPLETIVAEKYEAIVSLGLANSRYKDFYDIYILSDQYRFLGTNLKKAIAATFEHRNTSLNHIAAFEEGFSDDIIHQSRWRSFVKTKHAVISMSLEETIKYIKQFLLPVTESILSGRDFDFDWDNREREWKR